MADRPFPLAELTQKARQAIADGVPVFDDACSPDQILALAASLQQFRQWLVERSQNGTPWDDYTAFEDAVDAFDRAVSLEIEGRQE